MRDLSIYLHIPFCVRKCLYCDFLSFAVPGFQKEEQTGIRPRGCGSVEDTERVKSYVNLLKRQVIAEAENYRDHRVISVFWGGGTPSLLETEMVQELMDVLRRHYTVMPEAEVTIETNPGTVTAQKLQGYITAGINRISIGLQSTDDEELKRIGRIHDYRTFLETYRLAREAGFRNINIDLMAALPGQSEASYAETLRRVTELAPEHISAYSLIVEEGTSFYKLYGDDKDRDVDTSETTAVSERYRVCGSVKSEQKEREYLPLPNEDVERAIYEETEKLLQQYGYNRYEISNYAKKGYACRHNEGYWRRKEYLGIGLGASSLIGKQRYRNLSRYDEYIDAVQNRTDIHEETEYLEKTNEMEEFMFLGLRMMEGVSRTKFYENFEKEIEEVYGEQLMRLAGDGLIRSDEERIELTKRGIDISNYVFEQFLLE